MTHRTASPARRSAAAGAGAALLLAALAAAGCGSSSSSSSSSAAPPASTPATTAAPTATSAAPAAGGGALKLAAGPSSELKFSAKSLSAKAGTVAIDFTNATPIDHNVTVASASGSVVGETPTFHGGAKTVTLKLTAGTYKFYCSVPGHRGAGMEGTLTVQ